uniref:Cyclin n=1 Tax=Lotharella oceanica TaxID=641309 RepID=A0A7S2X8Q9_9EUKA|eukprot:CAMPEP_0170178218 /NCGR_PEP_ID=MMETSP0040_2-20121228/11745_1 /TAXON_ID=641309 /ORGANISM="Lotharella oceanica, Strain CCMP622" /LENGTH=247 /DNA_ID=CAMNT_0010421221 /DNA_START=56 /DNA_END=799 /DNA_ORIENTATION=+
MHEPSISTQKPVPMEQESRTPEYIEKLDFIARNFSTPPTSRKKQPISASASGFLESGRHSDAKIKLAKPQHRSSSRPGGSPDIKQIESSAGEVDNVVFFLDCIARRLVHHKEKENGIMTSFHSIHQPSISIGDYVKRISQFAKCSPQSYILAVIYIDRLVRADENIELSLLTIHRLVLTAITVASKFMDDHYHSNATLARIGGTSGKELNQLELEFVFSLRFELHVSPECFSAYRRHIGNFRATHQA